MLPPIVGSAALLVTGAIFLHEWGVPRSLIAVLGTVGFASLVLIGAPASQRVMAPAAARPVHRVFKGPAPVFEGSWDTLNRRRLLPAAG